MPFSYNYFRYRNKFTVKPSIEILPFGIQPYIADEAFYDFDAETLNANRLYGGFTFNITMSVKAEIYYMWQSKKSNDKWSDTHVLGTKLKFPF